MPNPTFDLTGKTAFLTGASRGLGKGFALTLARAGCDLAITARSVEDLAETVAAIEALGLDNKVLPLALDVRDHDSIRTFRENRHPCQQRRLQPPQTRA